MSDDTDAEDDGTDGERKKRPGRKPDAGPPASIKPVAKRIGEAKGNLRRRSEWFRKRSQRSRDQT